MRPSRQRIVFLNIAKLSLVTILLFFIIAKLTESGQYNWQWFRVTKYIYLVKNGILSPGPLLKGLGVTLEITGLGMLLTMFFGLSTAIFRLSGSIVARGLARIYLEFIRNTPLLVQILFFYFVLAPVFQIDRFACAVISLGVFEGAYASEIFRAGILSVEKGQWEASYSLGLSKPQSLYHIVFPQALGLILPPLTNQAVSLVKDSALVSTIAVLDLTMQGEAVISETFLTFEIWFTVAAIYLTVNIFIASLARWMERKIKYY